MHSIKVPKRSQKTSRVGRWPPKWRLPKHQLQPLPPAKARTPLHPQRPPGQPSQRGMMMPWSGGFSAAFIRLGWRATLCQPAPQVCHPPMCMSHLSSCFYTGLCMPAHRPPLTRCMLWRQQSILHPPDPSRQKSCKCSAPPLALCDTAHIRCDGEHHSDLTALPKMRPDGARSGLDATGAERCTCQEFGAAQELGMVQGQPTNLMISQAISSSFTCLMFLHVFGSPTSFSFSFLATPARACKVACCS